MRIDKSWYIDGIIVQSDACGCNGVDAYLTNTTQGYDSARSKQSEGLCIEVIRLYLLHDCMRGGGETIAGVKDIALETTPLSFIFCSEQAESARHISLAVDLRTCR